VTPAAACPTIDRSLESVPDPNSTSLAESD